MCLSRHILLTMFHFYFLHDVFTSCRPCLELRPLALQALSLACRKQQTLL